MRHKVERPELLTGAHILINVSIPVFRDMPITINKHEEVWEIIYTQELSYNHKLIAVYWKVRLCSVDKVSDFLVCTVESISDEEE
jgi:hypothetical protein